MGSCMQCALVTAGIAHGSIGCQYQGVLKSDDGVVFRHFPGGDGLCIFGCSHRVCVSASF